MFDQLRKALSKATRGIVQKELTEKDINNIFSDLELDLLQSDIAQEVIDHLFVKLKSDLVGMKLEKEQNAEDIINTNFRNAIVELFLTAGQVDLLQKIKEKKERKIGPFVIAFLGINGTGKTTTVAKVAHLLRNNNISVVLAAGDTHRAGAIEQLSRHADRLSLKVVAQRYGADPSAVGRDAIDYAKKHYVDAVLVDTAGRMQTAKNLMDEINKIVRVVKPDIKLFVGDALAGNDTINQARDFFQYTNFDGAILTKVDADAKGGAAISIVYITSKPIIYLGIGQGYDDIVPFDAGRFLDSIFRGTSLVNSRTYIPYALNKHTSPVDTIFQDNKESEKEKAQQELPEEGILSRKRYESTKLGDPQMEKERLNDSQLGQTRSMTSPTSENISISPDTSLHKDPAKEDRKHIIEESKIKISSKDKNKKTKFGGLFDRWKKGKNDQRADQTSEIIHNKDIQKEIVSATEQSDYEKKAKKDDISKSIKLRGQQENKERDDSEHKDKDDGDVVYLSNEDIEDMLK
ncbi:MAG TPA: signal recognition particle-docking protein FtsY [Nitrososphaeraceae archaeon]|nr:signal recognition particle-docking protein FtsY [Nitrososphaeraceae archaeon]